jgi:hypothetical protein
MTIRGYALGPGDGLDGDSGLKATGRALAAFHAAHDWAERDAVAAEDGLSFPR